MAETEMSILCVPHLSQSHLTTLSLISGAGNPQKVGHRKYHSSKARSSVHQVASMCFQGWQHNEAPIASATDSVQRGRHRAHARRLDSGVAAVCSLD